MGPEKVLKAIILPLTCLPVLLVVALFTILLSLAYAGMMAGIYIALLIVLFSLPPVFRYQLSVVESCARGKIPGALDSESFNWIGGLYTFFPLPLSIAYVAASYYAWGYVGNVGLISVAIFSLFHYPAALALLAITHSPLQSINPVAIFHLYRRSGDVFWMAPVYLVLLCFATELIGQFPMPVVIFLQLVFMYSFAALVGTLIAPEKLVDDVYIPDAIAPTRSKEVNDIEQARTLALNHGYGFISRNNREGGFKHIIEEIERDPLPTDAWRWYFERMLKWDESYHALFFAQHYIRDLLRHGETIPAQKMVMRCLMMNEQFRPFPEDIPTLIDVAEDTGNDELVTVLKGM